MVMEKIKSLFAALGKHLDNLARWSSVVAKPISVGDRHVVPLVELSLAYGGGGGQGEGPPPEPGKPAPSGTGGGAGGAAKACPVAVLVIEGGKARLEKIGD
jgi:uncharacterized spore protein YtfJ